MVRRAVSSGTCLAGEEVFLERDTVPLGNRIAVFVDGGDLLRPGHEGVAVFDVVEVADDGNRRLGVAAGAEVPLQVADPEDEIGDRRRREG